MKMNNTKIYIKKSNDELELFSFRKLEKSLQKSGALKTK